MNQKTLIAVNTASAYARQVVRLLINLALVPFVLSRVGAESYGLFQTVLSISGIFLLLELGMSEAVTRFIAREHALGDEGACREVWLTALAAYLVPAAGVICLLVPASPWLARWLMPGAEDPATPTALLLIAWGMLALSFPALAYRGVLRGLQRGLAIAAVEIAADLARAALIVGVLLFVSQDIAWVLAITALAAVCANLGLAGVVHRSARFATFQRSAIHRDRLRSILAFSIVSFIGQIGFLLNLHVHRLILSRMLGPAAVTAYFLASFVREMLEELVMRFTSTMTPAAARFQPLGNTTGLQQLLLRGTRYAVLMAGLAAGPIAAFAEPLLRIWLWRNPEYADLAPLMVAIVGVSLVELTRGSAPNILVGMARQKVLAIANLSTVVLDAGLAIALLATTSLGLWSLVISTATAVVLRRAVVFWNVCSVVGVSKRALLARSILWPLLPGAVSYVLGVAIQFVYVPSGWIPLLLCGAATGSAGLAFAAGVTLTRDERRELVGPLHSLLGRTA